MDRRTLFAIVLCFLIFMGWQKLYIEPRLPQKIPPHKTTAPVAKSTAPVTSQAPKVQKPEGKLQPPASAQPQTARTIGLSARTGDVLLGNGRSLLTDWSLRNYKLGIEKDARPVDLNSVTNEEGNLEFAFDDPELAYLIDVRGTFSPSGRGEKNALWFYEDNNVRISKEISPRENAAYLDLKITAEFKTKRPKYAFVSLFERTTKDDPEKQDRKLIYYSNRSTERVSVEGNVELTNVPTSVKYVAATNRYFVFAVMPTEGEPTGLVQPAGVNGGRLSLVYPVTGNAITIPVKIYFGPKELDLLRSVEPTLDHTVDFGWFTIFAYPILKLLKWLYHYLNNYGAAIIILTLLLKIATYPLTYKSMKSMKEMAKLQPQLQRIREKYKDDREALNRETMTMMRSHGYNPMAGCLPIVVQMPIFFALYQVLYSSIELYHAPFAMWIHDLSSRDPYYVTPILLSLTMFIQQKLTPSTATDPMQARIIQFMPLIFGAFMLALPSGLTVYMLANAIASIVQQIFLNKKLELGHVKVVTANAR